MRYIEVTVNTPGAEIDARCQEMADMGAGGFVIENEEDFKDFLEQNHQYWDYVDDELENQFAGVSRIKCYLTDDEDGLAVLRRINAAYDDVTTSYVEDSDWENNWREIISLSRSAKSSSSYPNGRKRRRTGGSRSGSTPVLSSAPAVTRQRACALPRSRSFQSPVCVCSTSAAAAAFSASARSSSAVTAASAWISILRLRT